MFVEIKAPGELLRDGENDLTTLSGAIRAGIKILPSDREAESNRWRWTFCALGCAFAGVNGRMMNEDEYHEVIQAGIGRQVEYLAKQIGFPVRICERVSAKHYKGWSAERCADWLEAQGY